MFEKTEKMMVSHTGGIPTLRKAYFLKPHSNFVSETESVPLSLPVSCDSTTCSLNVTFSGFPETQPSWAEWLDRMHFIYFPVWKDAGIDKAIMGSVLRIPRNDDLIYGLADRWCSQTNTFVFPWGEATITLEDMLVLGGFSLLGHPFSLPLEFQELVDIKDQLEKVRQELKTSSSSSKARHSLWLEHFMESGSCRLEHEAFLSLWLSRYVFPGKKNDCINKHVFPIAIHLARGTRIALAPSVLASIYRDLRSLKQGMILARLSHIKLDDFKVCAPFVLVQSWAWERIPQLQPTPRSLNHGELRLARWHGVKDYSDIANIPSLLASAGKSFLWRPYAIAMDEWAFPKFYTDKGGWFYCDLVLREELVCYIRCLRECELVGLGCKECYFPNRVAMQFGIDQDIPGSVPPSKPLTAEIAWREYSRPITNAKLYIPPRLFEADITVRYLRWWNSLEVQPKDAVKPFITKKRSLRRWKRFQEIITETDSKCSRMCRSVSPSIWGMKKHKRTVVLGLQCQARILQQ